MQQEIERNIVGILGFCLDRYPLKNRRSSTRGGAELDTSVIVDCSTPYTVQLASDLVSSREGNGEQS